MTTYTISHGFYGCETGCCGTRVEWEHPDGTGGDRFDFSEPEFIPSTDEERCEVLNDLLPGEWRDGDTVEFIPEGFCHIRSNRDLQRELKDVRAELATKDVRAELATERETSLKKVRAEELDSVLAWLDMLCATCRPDERRGVRAAMRRVAEKRAAL